MRSRYVLAVLFLFLFSCCAARAQTIDMKKIGGKTVMCMHSGLMSNLKDCGTRADSYTYVFVGVISAITPNKNDEKEIQVAPEEVFLGAPPTPLTVVTSQGLCLPKLVMGDRWLFYLQKEKHAPVVLDYYSNDSVPVADAQEQIKTLRQLQTIGDFGILRGQVIRGWVEGKGVPDARVTAERASDGLEFFSTTGPGGYYEFQPLPPGGYKITVDPIGSYQPDESSVDVSRGGCWDLTLDRSPHGKIGGHVRRSDGSPVPNVDVVLINSDNSWYLTTQTDRNGQFLFSSQESGRFVVGLNFPARRDWFNGSGAGADVKIPPASLFYPGVPSRSAARVIDLATDQKIDNIDFVITKP
jgi:Carboxypeptidase regulatory-like domain